MTDTVIVCHGTRQDDRHGDDDDTAVTAMAKLIGRGWHGGMPGWQRRHVEGAGTRGMWLSRHLEMAFGLGLGRRTLEGMREWSAAGCPGQPGRGRLVILGYSRGGPQAVRLAQELQRLDTEVAFLGLWDPVGSYGIPGNDFDPGIPREIPSNVLRGHIVYAADEGRFFFPAKLWPVRDGIRSTWWARTDHEIGSPRGRSHPAFAYMHNELLRAGIPMAPVSNQFVYWRASPAEQDARPTIRRIPDDGILMEWPGRLTR